LYQEGELLADYGHRFDLYPRAYLPHQLGIVETLSEIGYRETLYFPKHGSSERRGVWTGRFEARTRFAKELGLGGGVRHVLEPRLGFAFLSTPNQDGNPLFIPASTVRLRRLIDGDLRILTRNPSDRLPDERFLLFQLVNRFYSLPGGRRVAEVRVGTGYDFEEEEWTRLFTAGSFAPASRWWFDWDVGYDPEESELEDAEVSLSFRGSPGNYLGLRYRYLRDASVGFENFVRNDEVFGRFRPGNKVKQLNVNLEWAVSRRIRLFAEGYTTLESASNGSGRAGFVLVSECGCWDLIGAIEHETRPRETRFVVVLNLLGFGRRAKLLGYELESTRDVRR
ncbi:MAG: LPS assembly protein LptD, partial [Myxococcota bacterium]